jgi:hypothetical protein
VFNVNTNIKCQRSLCSSFRSGTWKLMDRQSLFWYYSFHAVLFHSITFTSRCTQQDYKLYISFKNSYMFPIQRHTSTNTSIWEVQRQGFDITRYYNCEMYTILSVKLHLLIIKPTRSTSFSNLFWNETLHVSDSSSVHHQEFFTVHTPMVYVIQFCWQPASRIRM